MTSPQSEISSHLQTTPEYSPEERAILLRLAHSSIEATFRGETIPLDPPTPHLAEPRGAFTTLHVEGKLHGCVGYVVPLYPLYKTILETAVAAAFQDDRFPPVASSETPLLQIEISILSPLKPIRPEEVVIGKHGLVVSRGSFRGLLLPQVPVEWDWDCETFLAQTCRKAGLPADAWKTGAIIEAFTAEVFTELGAIQSR
jgi:AmmeMemoRadiSam system protein A